jgi:hypothetical protein
VSSIFRKREVKKRGKEGANLLPKSDSIKCMQLASPANVFIYSISWDLRAVLITAMVIG